MFDNLRNKVTNMKQICTETDHLKYYHNILQIWSYMIRNYRNICVTIMSITYNYFNYAMVYTNNCTVLFQ